MNIKKCLENIIENCKKMNLSKLILIFLFLGFIIGESISSKKPPLNKIKKTDQSDKLYKRARGLEKSGFKEEAEQVYNQIFTDFPSNERYYNALKKILIKNQDCASLMSNVNIFCEANLNSEYSKINKLEILLICNANWETLFYELIEKNKQNPKILKKAMSLLIKNNEENVAIKSINEIRNIKQNKAFFSNELAYHYLSLKKYPEALQEFLVHLEKNPKNLRVIKSRIMNFPNEVNLNKKNINILKKSDVKGAKVILADLYFKNEDFQEAILILKQNNLTEELLSLSINLNQLGKFDISNELLIYIIEKSNNKTSQKALFELANSLEKRSIKNKTDLNISGFMNQNDYFSSPFLRVNQNQANLMHRAIDIYDSLSINNNLIADFKLSEIQFKALGDLDSAYKLYNKVYTFTKNKELKLDSILSIADILIAKGQLDKALEKIDIEIESNLWNEADRVQLRLKQNQILFYQSELDFVLEDLWIISEEHPVSENNFNNIIEVIGVLTLFKEQNQKFEKFSKAQLKIHQNKRAEAINILASIDKKEDTILLNNLINYQTANLLVSQNKITEAIDLLKLISGEDVYNELAQILLAEIYDYILKDLTNAKIYYLSILQNFPKSIHYEQVRIRLKTIMDNPL